jgi:hypothetical protein
MKKKKSQESTSAGAIEKRKIIQKNRLEGMLEAIEKRSDPVKVHKIATEYFKAFRSERGLIEHETRYKDTENDLESTTYELEEQEIQKRPELTPVTTPVTTPVITRKKTDSIEPLDTTHTSSEAHVYSVMYRETISKGTNNQYFGTKRLMTLTGIRGDHTVRRAIDGLIQKMSIEIIDVNYGNPIGPKYRIFSPKEIIERRKRSGIEIDTQTKKIITPVETPVETPVILTGVTPVKITPVTGVKMTGVRPDIPYIKENKYKDDTIKSIVSSSKSSSNTEDDTDEAFNHRVYIISLYEKYTGNQWRVGDDEFYNNENLQDVLPEVIEAAIIASILRSKTKINSLAYFEGAIHEFQEYLPVGYLSYLREKWREKNGCIDNEGHDQGR